MTNRRFSFANGIQAILCLLALCGMNAAAEQDAQPVKEKARAQVNATAGFSSGLQAFLGDIQKKKEWKTADVMELVPQLQMYGEELVNYKHLPNQEALKDKFPDDHTVQILDLYYRYAVHRSFQTVAKDIEKMNGWNDDARLVVLAASCARHLDGSNLAKQLELGRRLVELEPKNRQFRQSLEWVEKELARKEKVARPRRQTVPVQKQQAQ